MATLLEFKGDNPFRIRAYRRAAQNLESFTGNLNQLAKENRLTELSGIGHDLAHKISEYILRKRISAYDELKRHLPPGVFELLEIPGIGPKTARLLTEKLHISTI